jgi:hypothetical protein
MPVEKDLFDVFYSDLDKISKKLFDNVVKMGSAIEGFSDTQIIRVSRELDFFIELQEAGFNTSFQKLMEGYDSEAEDILKKFQKVVRARTGGKAVELLLSPANTEAIAQQLQLLRDLDGEVLLGRFAQETTTMKSELLKGIIAGEPAGVVAERLALNFNEQLLSDRARMIARDAYADFAQTGTFNVFKQTPDQLFRYSGSKDKKNRPACRYFLDNQQNKKGFTAKEIKDLGKKMGQGKIPLPVYNNRKKAYVLEYVRAEFDQVKRGGHNCRHRFIPVGTRARAKA